MNNVPQISFYLASGMIRIHRSTIDILGHPRFIRFMVSKDGKSLLLTRAEKKDFQSFRVPKDTNNSSWKFEIGSIQFCRCLASSLSWLPYATYRISADSYIPSRYARFCLTEGLLLSAHNSTEDKGEN